MSKNLGPLSLCALAIVIGILLVVQGLVADLRFEWNCEAYLKRAADCSTIKQCGKELDLALRYMEANDLTSGNTGVFFKTPADDVGFWYSNIRGSRAAVADLESKDSVSALECSNVLMRVRETILDEDKHTSVTLPSSIAFYPNVAARITGIVLGVVLMIVGIACGTRHFNKY